MRELLNTLGKTLLDIGNFGMLLVLFMYIYALVGLQFFANRFHFDQEGAVVGIGEIGYYDADIPRSNFDSLMNAFTTIFEVIEMLISAWLGMCTKTCFTGYVGGSRVGREIWGGLAPTMAASL